MIYASLLCAKHVHDHSVWWSCLLRIRMRTMHIVNTEKCIAIAHPLNAYAVVFFAGEYSVLNAHIVDVIMKYALLYSRFTVAVFVAVQLNWKTNKMKWERKKTAIHLTNDIADFSPAFYYAPQWNVPWGRTFRKKCDIFLCISNKRTSDDKKLTFCEQKRFSLKLCLRILNMSESFVKKNILTKSKIIRGDHWFVNNCLFKFLPNIPIEIISKNVSHLRVKIMESVKNYKKIKAKKAN